MTSALKLIVKVLILTLQGRTLNFHGKIMVIPWFSSPYLLKVKRFILTMLELLLAFSPLFALLSRLYLRTVLVLLLSPAMLAWNSILLVTALRANGKQYWLFRNWWVPTSGNYPWRSEGWYRPTPRQCFQPICIFYPPLCSLCCKTWDVRAYRSQVISQPYIDMVIAIMKRFGIDFIQRTGSASMSNPDEVFAPLSSCYFTTNKL